MYRYLGSARLKTGEQMEIGVVECPDPSWGAQVKPLLGHKDRPTQEFFNAAFERPLDDLETRFYLGTIGGLAISNVMIVGARSGAAGEGTAAGLGAVGILGHVYTRPEHRQKGAYRHLMAAQMDDCRRLGYQALTLGTGFETHPYWIYHSFGFRSIDGVSGKMKWVAGDGFEESWLRPGATRVRPMRWDDWPRLNLLAFQPPAANEPLPRSWTFRVKGQGGAVEGMFQVMQRNVARGSQITALALESERGVPVGWAVLQPDDLAFGDGRLLDLYVHPAFEADAPQLLAHVPWPERGRVAAYTTGDDNYRTSALEQAGFRRAASLPGWLRDGDSQLDLAVWTRA